MRLYDFAFKNLKGNLYRYVMYYLSNVFTISVFYIFLNFLFHPRLRSGPLAPSETVNVGAENGIFICLIIIFIFTVLFISYATSIFLKSRGKEFGLLSLFGMTNKQIKKYVLTEGIIISLVSIISGVLAGMLFSKLFFMAMEAFMDISLPFNVSLTATLLTVIIFLGLFQVVNLLAASKIRNKEIVDNLKTERVPKKMPRYSRIKAALGVILLGLGYITAWIVDGALVIFAMIPVVLIVVLGTYFIFTQFSIVLANKLANNKGLFYNKTNMVAFSQMIFKLKDTAKVLFLASILGAITFTATETIYSFFTEIPNISGISDMPQDIAILQKSENLYDDESINEAIRILEDEGISIEEYYKVKLINVTNETDKDSEGNGTYILAISNSDYNMLARSAGREMVTVNENEVIYNYPFTTNLFDEVTDIERVYPYEVMELNLNGETKNFKVKGETHGSVTTLIMNYSDLVVLNDNDYKKLMDNATEKDIRIFNGINVDNWKRSYKGSLEIADMLGMKYKNSFYSKVIPYRQMRSFYGFTLFLGFFIAFLFFLATGSIIYFKLFNEIKQDGVEYGILKKIGITKKEMNSMITKQIAVIFFLPFIVSTFHSLFALKSLANLLNAILIKNGLIVMVGYFIFQGIYFLIIRRIFINRICSATGTGVFASN